MRELRTVLPYFRPYLRGFLLGLVFVFMANFFQTAGPYLIKIVIDALGDPGVTRGEIVGLAGLIVLAALVGGVFRFGMREVLNGISRRMETDLRNDFFRHLLRLDATFYGARRTGDLMSLATNDTQAVRMAIGPAVMYSVNTLTSFVFALALMLWISPKLTLYAMIPLLILPPIVLGFGRVIHKRFERIQEQFAGLSTFVQENLTGVRIVRAYTQEREQERRFEAYNEAYRRKHMELIITAGAFHPVLMLVSGIAMVLVTWLGGLEVMAGRITLGDFVAFGFYLVLLIWPMIALGWVVNLFQRGAASMGRINEIFRAEPAVKVPASPASLDGARGEVRFENVSFTYPSTTREVLSDIDFVARPGETVALVGPTGSGKSTIVALLTRLYDPTGGRILLDGVPLTAVDPADLRARIGMVPQDPFLFSDTISGNIGLGLDGAERNGRSPEAAERNGRASNAVDGRGPTVQAASAAVAPDGATTRNAVDAPEAVVAAARIAQLHEQIEEFPKQYGTLLGERGINLSGGQKQRATLARAVARDPLVLVLDDALSAVDTDTETKILKDLRRVLAGRTAFIISHRVSAVMNADQILVLEDGRIVQRGKHADLIGVEGTYARLLRRQLLEQTLESDLVPTGSD